MYTALVLLLKVKKLALTSHCESRLNGDTLLYATDLTTVVDCMLNQQTKCPRSLFGDTKRSLSMSLCHCFYDLKTKYLQQSITAAQKLFSPSLLRAVNHAVYSPIIS